MEGNMRESVFVVPKMDCPTEEQLIRNRLKAVKGIERLDFNLMARELVVGHELDDDGEILTALESLSLGAKIKAAGTTEVPEAKGSATKWLMLVSGLSAVAAEAQAWTSGVENSWPVIALAVLSILTGGLETLRKGLVAIRTFTLNINFLMTVAVTGAVLIGQWPEAAMVTFLFGLAELIEAYSLDRARNAIAGLMSIAPDVAMVRAADGEWVEVEAAKVEVGQVVRVRPGERIPLDGEVISGRSSVNQAPITGESLPVEKAPGDPVFAGTVNEKGLLELRVTANTGNTTLARIIRAVQQAQSQKAPTQGFVDRFARYYTPVVVVLALAIAIVPPLVLKVAFTPWVYKALVLLVIACPCALVISTPVTVVSGLATAARLGILVKGGVYLEEGHRLKVIALDKTGTLTKGTPVVTDVVAFDGESKDRILQLAASLDAPSEHPVASAIVAAWTGADATAPGLQPDGLVTGDRAETVKKSRELLPITDFQSITGRGVQATIAGVTYFVGNHRLAHENGVCGPHVEVELKRLEREGKTTVVISDQKKSLGVLGVADTLRDTSIDAVRQLHDLGVKTVMLTGDNETTAKAIARQVGIDEARGDMLPEDKLAALEELLRTHEHVGMVGDGINDAPALARSSIGFAMGAAGTDTAIETADVALMQDDLRKLPLFILLSRKTGSILKQNIAFAVSVKVVFFILALAGRATLWMAVFADLGASLLVVFNGLRLLRMAPRPEPRLTEAPRPDVKLDGCCDCSGGKK
jgi:Cd2+/Zn2+-exporting ATPase